jgi:hypothetical protein
MQVLKGSLSLIMFMDYWSVRTSLCNKDGVIVRDLRNLQPGEYMMRTEFGRESRFVYVP